MADTVFHPEAQVEYDEAIAWYQGRSPRTATRFEAEMDRVLGAIANHPAMFPIYDEENRFAILRHFPYTIVFEVQTAAIFIVAVAHSSRAPAYWRGRA